MKILHYSLGFPPFRTGGLTKYCMDLMSEQVSQGHDVALLWPGAFKKVNSSISVKMRGVHELTQGRFIKSFELYNSLPVPLLDGIRDIDAYTHPKNINPLRCFLTENEVQVFHVHTLMGLPKELLEACRLEGIRTVFTSHDYFGICPKWGLERNGKPCVNDHNCFDCVMCNQRALSLNKVRILQSNVYRMMKNTAFVKTLRRKHNASMNEVGAMVPCHVSEEAVNGYRHLRQYYVKMLESFDVLHFNSESTRRVYSRYCNVSHGRVITITNASIADYKQIRQVHKPVRFGYLGPATRAKGFFDLIEACDILWDENPGSFELHIYTNVICNKPYLQRHDAYQSGDLPDVMSAVDMVIVPSQWYETFGFTALEAMSFGIPVLLTENVGAKDLIENQVTGLLCRPSAQHIMQSMLEIIENPKKVKDMSESIFSTFEAKTMQSHAKEIVALYSINDDTLTE